MITTNYSCRSCAASMRPLSGCALALVHMLRPWLLYLHGARGSERGSAFWIPIRPATYEIDGFVLVGEFGYLSLLIIDSQGYA
jgi:hypothetical protein